MNNRMAELIEDGTFNRYIKSTVQYSARRDKMCKALKSELQKFVKFEIPNGDLAVWVQFFPEVDLQLLSENCQKHGLFYFQMVSLINMMIST